MKKVRKISMLLVIIMMLSMNVWSYAAPSGNAYSASKPGYGQVSVSSSLTIRSTPSTSGNVIGSLYNGNYVTIIGESGDFYYVVYNVDGRTGYVAKAYVNENYSSNRYYISINTESGKLNFRSAPTESSTVYRELSSGSAIAYYSRYSSSWLSGIYGGTLGFVSSQYASVESR